MHVMLLRIALHAIEHWRPAVEFVDQVKEYHAVATKLRKLVNRHSPSSDQVDLFEPSEQSAFGFHVNSCDVGVVVSVKALVCHSGCVVLAIAAISACFFGRRSYGQTTHLADDVVF